MSRIPLLGRSGVPLLSATGVRLINRPPIPYGLFLGSSTLSVSERYPLRWSSAGWISIGNLDGTVGIIETMAFYKGKLIAGGKFNSIGGVACNNIAAWDGVNWQPLGSGITLSTGSAVCKSLLVHDNELYVGGGFDDAGGVEIVGGIAKWNGSSWSPISGGSYTNIGGVYAMGIYGGDLVVGTGILNTVGDPDANGSLSLIARWDGSDFQPIGKGLHNAFGPNQVRQIIEFEGNLIVGGRFFRATNSDGSVVDVRSLARWDGSTWSEYGNLIWDFDSGFCESLVIYNDDLYVGGAFDTIGGVESHDLAKRDGSSWSTVGGNPWPTIGTDRNVTSMCVYENALAINGGIIFTEDDITYQYTFTWSEADGWVPLGYDGSPSMALLWIPQ